MFKKSPVIVFRLFFVRDIQPGTKYRLDALVQIVDRPACHSPPLGIAVHRAAVFKLDPFFVQTVHIEHFQKAGSELLVDHAEQRIGDVSYDRRHPYFFADLPCKRVVHLIGDRL